MNETPRAGVDAGTLVLRMAAYLALTGAALFALVAAVIVQFDRIPVQGTVRYVIPVFGSRATLDGQILTVLGACAGAMGAAGLGMLAFSRRSAPAIPLQRVPRRSRRPFVVLAAGLLVLALVILVRRHGP